jgi:hypothetical protein
VSGPESPLDRRLLAALRVARPAPRDVRARVRSRLETGIPEMRRDPKGGSGGGENGGPGRGLGGLGAHTIGVATFLLGGVTGAALFAALSATPSPQIVFVDRPAPQAVAAAALPSLAVPAPSVAAAPLAMPTPVVARAASLSSATPVAVRAPSTPHASHLTEERILLDEARAGLIQGEPERALDRLNLHRARFAGGLLAEERDAMQVEALVNAGRYDEARERASAFKARLPGSLFSPTVESAIASIP